MPCQLIYLTEKPVRVTGPNIKQDLRLSIDVGAIEQLELVLTVYEGTDVSVQVITGMQVESDLGWVRYTSNQAPPYFGFTGLRSVFKAGGGATGALLGGRGRAACATMNGTSKERTEQGTRHKERKLRTGAVELRGSEGAFHLRANVFHVGRWDGWFG